MALKSNDPRDTRHWRAFRLKVLSRDGYVCYYCQGHATSVDHIIPVSSNPDLALTMENCVSACKPCNSAKGNRSQAVFLGRTFTPPVFSEVLSPTRTTSGLIGPFEGQCEPLWS